MVKVLNLAINFMNIFRHLKFYEQLFIVIIFISLAIIKL